MPDGTGHDSNGTEYRYYLLLTAPFSVAPAVNFGTRDAAILIEAPVCGFRPVRGYRAVGPP